MEKLIKNPYFLLEDFLMNPTQEEADHANKFNNMVASVEFTGTKFIDGKATEEYSLFLHWKTQTKPVISTKEHQDKLIRENEIDRAVEAGMDYDSSEDKLI